MNTTSIPNAETATNGITSVAGCSTATTLEDKRVLLPKLKSLREQKQLQLDDFYTTLSSIKQSINSLEVDLFCLDIEIDEWEQYSGIQEQCQMVKKKHQRMTKKEDNCDDDATTTTNDIPQSQWRNDKKFDETLKQLVEFRNENGHTIVPRSDDSSKLYWWCHYQKKQYHKGNLRTDRIAKLNEIGFSWNVNDISNMNFNEQFEKLVKFRNDYGHVNVPEIYNKDPTLYQWCYHVRSQYHKGALEKKRIAQLNDIDFSWEVNPQKRRKVIMEQRISTIVENGQPNHENITASDVLFRLGEFIEINEYNEDMSQAEINRVLVAEFCFDLLETNTISTVRHLYYTYKGTHFTSIDVCTNAIEYLCNALRVPRRMLNLSPPPRGRFCGDVQLTSDENFTDGRLLASHHGESVTEEWLEPMSKRELTICTVAATFILVVETDGIFTYLCHKKFYEKFPCIIVTGMGVPDIATRAFVHALHHELNLPVLGLADCNPYGAIILNLYKNSKSSLHFGMNYSVPIQWVGLRPSQVESLSALPVEICMKFSEQDEKFIFNSLYNNTKSKSFMLLPLSVRQKLKDRDEKLIFANLFKKTKKYCWTNSWTDNQTNMLRMIELKNMKYKVELETLNTIGMDFLINWLGCILEYNNLAGKENARNNLNDTKDCLQII